MDAFSPTPALGFSARLADARQGLVGRAAAGYLHIKSSFASDPPSPCVRKVARFNCSFKGSSGPGPAEILGPTQPPPPPPRGQKLVQWHRGVKRRCKSAFLCLQAYLHPLISSTANSNSFC